MDPRALLEHAAGWVKKNPDGVVTTLRNAMGLRLTVPLDALRYFAREIRGKKAPKDLEIDAVPPGLRVGATLELMKTQIRARATLFVDRIRVSPEELLLELRLRDVGLAVIGQSDSPVAMLISSGALDLSKPGNVVAQLPKRPAFIVEATGDRLVIDLMRDPKIAARLRPITSRLTPILTISRVASRGDHLGLQLACFPDGLVSAMGALRASI
ncbi:MAG TPA: hypothetical protein VH142_19090 [Polyangiaceae bacterium]|jgi:hypothetical protein|nr:hypothetical protein [Polyangiaceae bacterium]